MNDLNREGHDSEIERLQEKMEQLDPASEEYAKIAKNYDILVRTANDDDRMKAETELERFKIDSEMDKIRSEEKKSRWSGTVTIIVSGVTAVGSIISSIIICRHNTRQVKEILFFEENGHTITTQSTKNLVRVPGKI